MRAYLLLSTLLLSTACHHSNTTSTDPNVRKMPFDNTVFLSIPHNEEQSILRRKLLNEALNERMKEELSKLDERFETKSQLFDQNIKTQKRSLRDFVKRILHVGVSYSE